MPSFKLTDRFGLSADVQPAPAGALVKYFKNLPDLLVGGPAIAPISGLDLDSPALASLEAGLSFQEPVAVGFDFIRLTIGANLAGSLRVFVPATDPDTLPEPDAYGDRIAVGIDQRYLSACFTFSVEAASGVKAGDAGFAFDSGTTITITNYRLFETRPSPPSLLSALLSTVSTFQIPLGQDDLRALVPGQIVIASGKGSMKFSGNVNLLSVVNPLATVGLLVAAPVLNVTAGESVQVGASFELDCEYQIRCRRLDLNRVLLGYYRKRSAAFNVSATAQAGLTAGIGTTDLLSSILAAISKTPETELEDLRNSGISQSQIADMQDALRAGVQRKLELAAAFELGALESDQPAFLYEIDLSALSESGLEALDLALRGDLTRLTRDEDHLPPGIKLIHSLLTTIRRRQHTLKINLLGIYNFISTSRLTSNGEILYDPESGELTFTDAATAGRIRASSMNLVADPRKLRRVLAESFLITAAYLGSRLAAAPPRLFATHSCFELNNKTNQQTMRDDLDVAVALGLMTPDEEEALVAGCDDFGRTTLYAATACDDAVTTALFLDGETARPQEAYESAGRAALELLIRRGDPDDYRRAPATSEDLWREMKKAGQFNFRQLFPGLSDLQVAVISADYTTIMWWAVAMAETAMKLEEIRRYFAANPGPAPDDTLLVSLRKGLAEHLRSVAATSREEFGEPWGLIAVDRVSGGRATAEVQYVGPRIALARKRA